MDTGAWWYVNGEWVHPQDARISINDVGLLRGYSIFESLRTYDHQPFHLDEHLRRLFHSAEIIEMQVHYEQAFLAQMVHEVIAHNTYKHATVRMLLTGGVSEDGILPGKNNGLAIMITELAERDMQRFARGVKLTTTKLQRVSPEAKTSNYVSAIRALQEARQQEASDALFVNAEGHVLEGTRSNFFVFRGDTLITPGQGVLLGVTRNTVLELARQRFQIEERPILLEELGQVEEAFITASSTEITPVVRIDDVTIGDGRPGKRTYELEQAFIALVQKDRAI
jgi:branched-chain amino acid aminotransferase